jgi:hypothetical protein
LAVVDGCRVRSGLIQADLLTSCGNMFSVGFLRSPGITRLRRYYEPLRLPTEPSRSYLFPPPVGTWPLGRVSQVPRLISPCPPSPITPGSPAAASTRCFTAGTRLHHYPAGWPLPLCVTRPNRVHSRYGWHFRFGGLRMVGLLRHPPPPLHGARASTMIRTFHLIRSTRLCLAHRNTQKPEIKVKLSSTHTTREETFGRTAWHGRETIGFYTKFLQLRAAEHGHKILQMDSLHLRWNRACRDGISAWLQNTCMRLGN